MSKRGENMETKLRVQVVRNASMTLGYIYYLEHGYSWTDYIIRNDIAEVHIYDFTRFIKTTRNHRASKSK